MNMDFPSLVQLGWSRYFSQQLTEDETQRLVPVRVTSVHRNGFDALGASVGGRFPAWRVTSDEERVAVGDWLLVDPATRAAIRILERQTVFSRKAAGTEHRVQVMAANVDTLFIVTSCNQDFNVARLERYLALAREAGVTPIVVITKADLVDDPEEYAARARALMPGLLAEAVNACAPESISVLSPWCGESQTVALLGSSGVGKSTLVNSLTRTASQATQGIREDDAHGRHTTTARSLHRLSTGGWLLDTPGMRELQLADVGDGIDDVFADIVALSGRCRFGNCQHLTEPGCAVQAAISDGTLDSARLERYRKLAREDARNSEAIWERHARERDFGKMAKGVMKAKRDSRDW